MMKVRNGPVWVEYDKGGDPIDETAEYMYEYDLMVGCPEIYELLTRHKEPPHGPLDP